MTWIKNDNRSEDITVQSLFSVVNSGKQYVFVYIKINMIRCHFNRVIHLVIFSADHVCFNGLNLKVFFLLWQPKCSHRGIWVLAVIVPQPQLHHPRPVSLLVLSLIN